MPPPRIIAALLVACPLAVAVGGCARSGPQRLEGRTLRVVLDEYRIRPRDTRVRPGRLRIVATNVGRLSHDAKVVKEDRGDREAPARVLGGTPSARPGETVTFTFRALQPGRYRLACTIANHDDLGQYGALVVSGRKGRGRP